MTDLVDLKPIVAGDDVSFGFTFTDDFSDPVDVVGDTLYLTLKSDKDLDDAEAEMQVLYSVPDDPNGRTGVVDFPVSGEDSQIVPRVYHYDFVWVKSTSDAGKKETVQIGLITVVQGVASF